MKFAVQSPLLRICIYFGPTLIQHDARLRSFAKKTLQALHTSGGNRRGGAINHSLLFPPQLTGDDTPVNTIKGLPLYRAHANHG